MPDHQASKIIHSGFIAQEVEKALQKTGYDDFSGLITPQNEKDNYGLRYGTFVIPIVMAIQEQQGIIQEQAKTIEQQSIFINDLNSQIQMQAIQNKKIETELQIIRRALSKFGVETD